MKRISVNLRIIIGLSLFISLITAAVFASWLTPYVPGKTDITQRLLPPNSDHWLGTDARGIDVWTSMLYGARVSIAISVSTVFITTFIGSIVGLIAGYFGGWLEFIFMRIIDVFLAFPGMLLTLTFATLFSPTYFSLVFAISLTGWIGSARLVRSEILSLKEREFVVAAKALGITPFALLRRHLFPAVVPLVLTHMTSSLSTVILIESSLSFLGLGPRENVPTWGQILSEGRTVMAESPLLSIAPGIAIFTLTLGAHLLSDALKDRFGYQKFISF